MSFDIVDYYSSISEGLFCEALNWTKSSLLFDGKDFWKKSGGSDFDIQMSSWDSAESTDVVGMFLLNKVNQIKVNNYGVSGKLYKDDELMATRMTPRLNTILKDKLIELFDYYGLKLKINCNVKIVNFLDITLNLNTGTYHPYMKPNNTIRYINTSSNHPPATIANIAKNINNRP